VDRSRDEVRRLQRGAQVGAVGLDAGNPGARQRLDESLPRGFARLAARDDLGQQRIVKRRDLAAAVHAGLDAHAAGERDLREQAGAGLEVAGGILGVEPGLDGRAPGDGDVVAGQRFARGQTHHPFDQVDPGDLLGDAVLDLDARVHLQEIEGAAARVDHELDGAGRPVLGCRAQTHRRFVHRRQGVGRQPGGRRLLDHLLVAPLQRAVPLPQRQHPTRAVAEDLHLDVPGGIHQLLQVDPAVLEVTARQADDRRERRLQLLRVGAAAHPDPAAAGGALQHDRIADLAGRGVGGGQARQQPRAGQQRQPRLRGQRAGPVLEAERPHVLGRGADEDDSGRGAALGEVGVFGQEAVAGVDGLGAGAASSLQNALDVQVALGCGGAADGDGLVGGRGVQRAGVGVGVDRHAADAQAPQRPEDAARDGAAIRDQDLAEHGISRAARPAAAPASGRRRCRGC
jgi:hypothetical protein